MNVSIQSFFLSFFVLPFLFPNPDPNKALEIQDSVYKKWIQIQTS